MPLVAVTGLPGHGKTLYTLWRWKQEAEKEGRPVFHNNIPGLNIEGWQTFEVEKWAELPKGAIFIIDEAQKVFPVRGAGRPPKHIEDLTTHRHLGLDGVLIFQNPMLVDSFVRRLIDRHFHVSRKFGTKFATIFEFVSGLQDNVKARKDAIRHEWRYPKEVFGWYKSSELHTVKARIPARVWLLAALPFIFGGLVWAAWSRLNPEAQVSRIEQAAGVPAGSSKLVGSAAPGATGGRVVEATRTPEQYLADYAPRIRELPHTAPAYDHLTKPTAVPVPSMCIASVKRCSCYTQQATRMEVSDTLCRAIARDGFFQEFNPQQTEARQQASTEARYQLPPQVVTQNQNPGQLTVGPVIPPPPAAEPAAPWGSQPFPHARRPAG